MEGARLNGTAAAVMSHSILNPGQSLPSRSASAESTLLQFHLPTSTFLENAACLRRLRSDVPNFRPKRFSRAVAAATLNANLLGKSSRKGSVEIRAAVAPVLEVADHDVTGGGLEKIYKESISARLENAYKQASFELLMNDLEAKLGLDKTQEVMLNSRAVEFSRPEEVAVESEVSRDEASSNNGVDNVELSRDIRNSSSSSVKIVKKPSTRMPKVEGNRIVRISKNPATRRPRKVISRGPKELSKTVEEPTLELGGKRRLSLRSRIAMRRKKQESVELSPISDALENLNLNPGDQDLWSQEADDLINKYSISLDLAAPLWDKLDRGLLTAPEESRLAMRMKPMKKLEKMSKVLTKQLGREPTDEEFAAAAGLDLLILRRRLTLGRAARTKLIQSNLRLVLSQAYKYYKESMSLSIQDLCQEGVVGLMHAVDKFDPGKGYRFSTYGIYWIRNSILRAQTKSGHMLRSPHNVSMHRVNIKRAAMELGQELGRPPTDDEIRIHLGITADRYRDILRTNMRTSSLHEHDRVTGRERVENIADNEDAMSVLANKTSMLRYGVDDVLDSLRPKENMVLRQRFGLDGKGQRSLSEVGFNLNLSREMVRRHELRGILKLKHPTRVEYLRNYLS